MLRSLIILAAIFLLYLLIKRQFGAGKSPASNNKTYSSEHKKTVQCLECNTYIPDSEAVLSDDKYFCCQQHLRDWQSKQN
jgi:hypothetical protein